MYFYSRENGNLSFFLLKKLLLLQNYDSKDAISVEPKYNFYLIFDKYSILNF